MIRLSTAPVALALGLLAGAGGAPPKSAPPPSPPPRPAPPPKPTAPPPAAPVWTIDKAASRLSFKAATTGQPVDGVFKKWDAQVAFDPKNLKASRILLVMQTASAVTGNPAWDQALASPAWFSPKKFPKLTFVSRIIVQTAPGRFTAIGELKARGVARRANLDFVVSRPGVLTGTLPLDRSSFALGPPGPTAAKNPAAPIPPMANVLSLNVRLSARKH